MNETHNENDEEVNCLNCYQQHMMWRRQNPIFAMKGLYESSMRALAFENFVKMRETNVHPIE